MGMIQSGLAGQALFHYRKVALWVKTPQARPKPQPAGGPCRARPLAAGSSSWRDPSRDGSRPGSSPAVLQHAAAASLATTLRNARRNGPNPGAACRPHRRAGKRSRPQRQWPVSAGLPVVNRQSEPISLVSHRRPTPLRQVQLVKLSPWRLSVAPDGRIATAASSIACSPGARGSTPRWSRPAR